MPDPRLMWAEQVQSKQQEFEPAEGSFNFLTPTFNLLFFGSRAMDVIGTAATLYRKQGMKAMLFHLTTDDHIHIINEQGPAETDAGGSTFASEQELHEVAKDLSREARTRQRGAIRGGGMPNRNQLHRYRAGTGNENPVGTRRKIPTGGAPDSLERCANSSACGRFCRTAILPSTLGLHIPYMEGT